MEIEEDDILYGINAPARNIPELSIATQTLINEFEELSEANKQDAINRHLDNYVNEHPLPSISFNDISLEWFNVSDSLSFEHDLSGHVVVLDFFTYCCINCLHILPDLHDIEEKYKPNKSPLAVIGVHSSKFDNERLTQNVDDALRKLHITHPVANDLKCELWDILGISCWPTLVIVGPGGIPLFVLMGEGHRETLFNFVEISVQYFSKKKILEPNMLPLSPQLHLPSLESDLYYPGKVDTFDNTLIIADSGNNRVILTDLDGEVKCIIGCGKKDFEDGSYKSASFNNPQGVVYHPDDVIFVADTNNHAIRKIDFKLQSVETVAGNGKQGLDKEGGQLWTEQALSSPWDLSLGYTLDIDPHGHPNLLYIAMAGTHQIWAIFLTGGKWIKNSFHPKGTVIRLAGSGQEENRNTSYPLKAGFAQPSGISVGRISGQILYIADSESSSIRQMICDTGTVKKVAGGGLDPNDLFAYGDVDGGSNIARFQHPLGVVAFKDEIYVADSYNHKVKLIKKKDKTYETETLFGGRPSIGRSSSSDICTLNEPGGLCITNDGKRLFVADTNNSCIKEFSIDDKNIRRIDLIFTTCSEKETSEDTIDSNESFVFYVERKKSEIELKMILTLPSHVHLTPGAPQSYSLMCSNNVSADPKGSFSHETIIPIQVDLSENASANLCITTKLCVCFQQGTCAMKEYATIVQFWTNENETKDKTIIIELKPDFNN